MPCTVYLGVSNFNFEDSHRIYLTNEFRKRLSVFVRGCLNRPGKLMTTVEPVDANCGKFLFRNMCITKNNVMPCSLAAVRSCFFLLATRLASLPL